MGARPVRHLVRDLRLGDPRIEPVLAHVERGVDPLDARLQGVDVVDGLVNSAAEGERDFRLHKQIRDAHDS